MNTSLLGKLIWSLLHDKDKRWVKVLSSKYLKGDSILSPHKNRNVSPEWRSILKALEVLKD
ncbi:putative ribonuclease H protein, partial [Sesbania bispinosa]